MLLKAWVYRAAEQQIIACLFCVKAAAWSRTGEPPPPSEEESGSTRVAAFLCVCVCVCVYVRDVLIRPDAYTCVQILPQIQPNADVVTAIRRTNGS